MGVGSKYTLVWGYFFVYIYLAASVVSSYFTQEGGKSGMCKKKVDKIVLLARSDAYLAAKSGIWTVRPKQKYYRPKTKRELQYELLIAN